MVRKFWQNLILLPLLFSLIFPPFFSPSKILAQSPDHLKYFGYYRGWEGAGYLSAYSNLLFVSNTWKTTSIPELLEKDIRHLNLYESLGMKGILEVTGVFFDLGNWTLRSDWESRWEKYWLGISPHLSKIGAFYPLDEPDIHVSPQDYARMVKAIKTSLKATSFKIPLAMVVTSSGVLKIKNGNLTVPPEIDWLGFDEYDCWGKECFGGLSIAEKLDILIGKIRPRGGKVILVLDGRKRGTQAPTIQEQEIKIQRARNFYNLAKSRPEVVGMFVFLWSSLSMPGLQLIGTEEMPLLEKEFKWIGEEILKITPTPTITPKPTPTPTPTPTLRPTSTPSPSPTPTTQPTATPRPSPILSPTPTPTLAPGKALLKFILKFWEWLFPKAEKTVTLVFTQGSQEKYRFENLPIIPQNEGYYLGTVFNLEPGDYDLFLQIPGYLRKKISPLSLAVGLNTQDWSQINLLVGDMTGDNQIKLDDVTAILSVWTRSETPVGEPTKKYDLNGDGLITLADVTAILANWTAPEVKGDE